MNLTRYCRLFCLAAMFLTGCKKYPDGPLLNLIPKESRIDAQWDVEYFSIDGYDSTAYLKSKPFYAGYSFTVNDHFASYAAGYPYNKTGTWELQNKKNDLYVHFAVYFGLPDVSVGPYGANDVVWEIRRLQERKLWLKTTYNNKVYYVKFKKI
jgi:hypothetical protein